MTRIQDKVFFAIEVASIRRPGRYLDVNAVIEECRRQGLELNRTQVRKALYRLTCQKWCESVFKYGLRFYRVRERGRSKAEGDDFFSRWLISTKNNRRHKTMQSYFEDSRK